MKRLFVPIGVLMIVAVAQAAHSQTTPSPNPQPQTTQSTPMATADQAQCEQLREQMKQDLAQVRKDRQAHNTVAVKQDLDKARQDRRQFRDTCGQAMLGSARRH